MSDTIDQLSIEITADASKAEESISRLIKNLRSLNDALNLGNIGNFKRQLNSIKVAADSIKEVTKSMRGISNAGKSLYDFSGTEKKETKDIDSFIASVKELQGITLPNFSNVTVLANGLNRLAKVDSNKIVDIANALGMLKNTNLDGIANAVSQISTASKSTKRNPIISDEDIKQAKERLGQLYEEQAQLKAKVSGFRRGKVNASDSEYRDWVEQLENVSAEIAKIENEAKSFTGISRALTQDDKALGDVLARMKDLREYIASMKKGLIPADAEGFKAAEHELAVLEEQYRRHKKEVQEAAKAQLDFKQAQAEIGMVERPLLTDGLESQIERAKNKLHELYAEQKELQTSISDFKHGEIDVPDEEYASWKERLAEIKAEIDAIENSSVSKATNSIREMGVAAQEVTEKLSKLDEYIKKTLDGGFVQNGVSAELAEVLKKIQSLQFELGAMKQRPEIFDRDAFVNMSRDLDTNKRKWEEFERTVSREIRSKGGLDKLSQEAQILRDRMEDLNRLMSEMDSGKTGIDVSQYQAWNKELKQVKDRYDEIMGKKNEVEKPAKIEILAGLVTLAHELKQVTDFLGGVADKMWKGLKIAFKPLEEAINEYKEKILSIGEAFDNLKKRGQKALDNLSRFWKRVMKTFTFMLVRKAITAVLKEMSDAIKSLALWSKQFGTIFNDSMSQITSNFSYIARSIVGAFEPIINYLVPAFNALADAIAHAAAKLGEFFAALTGQGYYMAAKRQVTDYAESVDKANKAQKNLIAGLDDLNVITTPTSTSSGIDDLAGQWEKVEVSDKMKDFVDDVKDLAQRLFDPIKKAWDEAGDHVKKGFKYMVDEIGKLGKSIGRDFMKVWEQPETSKIFEDIFHTVGYIEEGIGNLAKRFREAWDEGDKGLHILENIRDIVKIITGHVRDMAETFRDWAAQLNFNPLLEAIETFTKKVQPLVDFLGNVLGDIWERVILRHWQFQIEKGIPHLLETISDVISKFDFDKIRKDLQPVEDAFETMRESIDIGLTNAIGNLGTELAKFANSEEFTKFCETIAWVMDQVTPERVEKLFTALGLAIGQVAGELIKFVNSDKFKDFLQRLLDWYDSKSAEDIADILVKIAKAISLFKFAQFVGGGVTTFLEVITMLKTLSTMGGLKSMLASTTAVGGEEVATGILGKVAASMKSVGGAILKGGFVVAIATGIALLIGHWGEIEPVLAELADKIFYGLGVALGSLAKFIAKAFIDAFNSIGDFFGKEIEECGGNIILGILKGMADALLSIPIWIADHIFKPIWDGICSAFGIHSPAESMYPIGGFIIMGLFEGIKLAMSGISTLVSTFIFTPLMGALKGAGTWLLGAGKSIIGGLISGISAGGSGLVSAIGGIATKFAPLLPGGLVVAGIGLGVYEIVKHWDDICAAAKVVGDWVSDRWSDLCDFAGDVWGDITNTISDAWDAISDTTTDIVNGIGDFLSDSWNDMKKVATDVWNATKEAISKVWDGIKRSVSSAAEWLGRHLEQAWNGMKRVATDIWNGIKGAIETVWNGITTSVSSAAEWLGRHLEGAWNGMKNIAIGAWEGIKSGIDGVWRGIQDVCSWAVSELGGFLEDAWDGISRTAKTAWEGISDFASGAWRTVKDLADDAWRFAGDVAGAVADGANSLKNTVGDIASGFMKGVSNVATDLWNGGKELASNVVGGFKDFMGIHSPSKVFEEFGKLTVEGFNEGLDESAGSTEKSLKSWFEDMSNFSIPQFDISNAIPKDTLQLDAYGHTNVTGVVDNTAIQTGVRQGVMDAIGSMLIPYLSDIAQSSRETADKNLTISDKAIGQSAQRYARDFQTRTGRPAFNY